MTKQQEQNKRIKAALTTLGVNVAILLILMFAAAWQIPGGLADGDLGIEVNLGDSEVGSGDIQPTEPVGTEKPQEDEPEAAQSPNQDEVVPENTAPAETAKPVESAPVEPVTTSDEESPVEIKKDKPKEVKPAEKVVEKPKEKPEVKTPVEKTVEKPKEKPEVKEEKKQPVADVNAVYKPGVKSKTDGTASGKEGKPGSEGDDAGKEGDKGVVGGTPGAAVYKGTPGGGGGGGGPALDLAGWDWDNIPKPNIQNSEPGRVVFEIKVDSEGNIMDRKKISGSLSAAAEQACIRSIEKLTFTKKAGANVPDISVGRITFVVRAE